MRLTHTVPIWKPPKHTRHMCAHDLGLTEAGVDSGLKI